MHILPLQVEKRPWRLRRLSKSTAPGCYLCFAAMASGGGSAYGAEQVFALFIYLFGICFF